jgi:hypothetical protein
LPEPVSPERRPGRHLELDVAQRPGSLLVVAERDALEAQLAAHRPRIELDRARALLDLDRQVQVLEDPLEQRERALQVDPDREERLQREEEPRLEGSEGHHGADRDRLAAAGDRQAREQVDERRHRREADLDRRHAPAPGHARPHLELRELARLALEAVGEL